MGELTGEQYAELPEVLTPDQAAAMLGMSTAQLLRLANAGEIPARRIGRLWRFGKTRLEEYLREG